MRELFDGVTSIPRAFSLIGTNRILKYVVLAGIFGLIVGISLSAVIYFYYDDAGAWLAALWPWEWGEGTFASISKWVVLIFAILFLFFSFKYLVIILLAPILSYISEVIEEELTGNKGKPFSIKRLFYEIGRSLRINIRNIFKELFYTIILFFISLLPIPGVRLITTPLIIAIQAYYMGFGNLDFFLERHYNYSESLSFVRKYRMLAIGNGLGFLILFSIPILGFILAPTLSAIAATVEGIERMDEFDNSLEMNHF
jgi:CysZ protein